eukprot:s2279_g9.t2
MAQLAEPPVAAPVVPHQQLYSLTRSSAWREVLQMWCRFQNRAVETNIRMYNSVLSACGKSQWQRIQLLLSSSLGATTVTYNTALASAESTWRQAAAYEKGLQLDIITLNSFISSNNTLKAWLKALELLDSAAESNLQKDLITFNVTMRGCQWFWAEALLEAALENQLLPDLVSYNTAISALEEVSRWRGIFSALQEMQQLMLQGDSITQFMLMGALNVSEDGNATSQWRRCLFSLRGIAPPSVALANRALVALTDAGNGWEEAVLLMVEMEGQALEPDVVTYNSLIKAQNTWHATLQMLSEISMRALRADLVTYNELLTQRWALTWWTFAELQRRQLESDLILFNAAIFTSGTSRWDAASVVFQELRMEKLEADRISYNSVTGSLRSWQHAVTFQARSGIDSCNSMLSAYERESEWHRAFHLLGQQDAVRAAADVVSCNTVMSACEKSQHWALCFTIFEMARETSADLVTFGTMMSACEAAGRWQDSLFLLEQLDVSRFQSNVVICNSAISSCEKASLWQHALSLWASFPLRRVTADVISYSATSSACEKCGRWEVALQLLSELVAAQLEADSILFGACISACEKGSQWLAAITLLRRAADCTNLVTYNAAISACEKGLAWRSALALCAELQQQEVQADVISYNAIITACQKGQQWQQVLRLLEDLEKTRGTASVIALSNAILACDSQRHEMEHFCGSLHSVTTAMLANLRKPRQKTSRDAGDVEV